MSPEKVEVKQSARADQREMLYGWNDSTGLVALEPVTGKSGAEKFELFFRSEKGITKVQEQFTPFILANINAVADCPVEYHVEKLKGPGSLNTLAVFRSWKQCMEAKKWIQKNTGFSPSAPNAPYLFINDPVQQHLALSGRTLFAGLRFEQLKRMQVDIECYTSAGYEFCNAEREGDRIIAIAMSDETGWVEVISGAEYGEKELLKKFVKTVTKRDPDVIEGYNIFGFDLPYIVQRAKMNGVKLSIGRDGSAPKARPSRFTAAERTVSYTRFDVFGRHVVDILFMVHVYDVSHRSLTGLGLKEVAVHFGLSGKDRVYIEGSRIALEFDKNPDKVMRYAADDVRETRALSNMLSQSSFLQAGMFPYSYQNVCVRGNATKIDALMIRNYIRQRQSIPLPEAPRPFAGGYTDIFMEGIVENVHHCDVRSLYPSLMLTRNLAPGKDKLGVFLELLKILRTMRLHAKEKMIRSNNDADRDHYDALQSTFKVLINSFYGYLGFPQGHFCDFSAAERVAADGRELLKFMINWIKKHGGKPVEIDTDGIYFVPPKEKDQTKFRKAFADSLPEGIEVEFDGEYRSMYSYKSKNYALLSHDGEIVIKGAALKSRGLEPFQRRFMEEVIRLRLEKKDGKIAGLKKEYETAILKGKWSIEEFAKTERLQDSPSTYAMKRGASRTPTRAAYELALASGRDYRAGDQISYYVTGDKKNVKVHEKAKLISAWDKGQRDENIPYYLAKLEALYRKLVEEG